MLQKRGTVRKSCSGRVSALVMSAFSFLRQIIVMFEAHWPMKAFPQALARLRAGVDLTLNSLLRTWLSLKHPLSF